METEHPSPPRWVIALESTLQVSIAVMLVVLAVALVAKAVDAVHDAPSASAAATSRCASVNGQSAADCGQGVRPGGSPLLARNALDGGAGPGFYGARRGDCRFMAPAQRATCRQAAATPAAQ